MKKILVMGLPGAGKTTFAELLYKTLKLTKPYVEWFNADKTREFFNDWDFSDKGRIRQAYRMRDLARFSTADYVICDFVAPTEKIRNIFQADIVVWIDTIDQSKYEDTNKIFQAPVKYDFIVKEQNAKKYVDKFIREFGIEQNI